MSWGTWAYAGRHKVRTLMQRMRMKCVYRRPRATVTDATKYKHPYLLRGLKVERPHQVWAIDITHIPMRGGYMYLCAIIDLYSRYLVGWSVSNTMEAEWVCAVVRDAVALHGKPGIINSDQGSQFTSDEYQKLFKQGAPCEGVKDQHGRQGPGDRQRVHRALLAHHQTRQDPPVPAPGRC